MIARVAEQQAEQASFLWLLRDRAVHSARYTLLDLARLDNRIDAHLEGLSLAGDEGWSTCLDTLRWAGPGEVFTLAVIAILSGDADRIQKVLSIGSASPPFVRALVSAFGWLPYPRIETPFKRMMAAPSSTIRRIAIAAGAAHRRDPGLPLVEALGDEDPALRSRGLRAVGELGRADLASWLLDGMSSADPDCRFYAAWSAALLRDERSLPVLKSIASASSPLGEEAARMVLRCSGLSGARAWHRELAGAGEAARLAVTGAGIIGDPAIIAWLAERMLVPPLARLAGEAFTMITGADIACEHLERDAPAGFEAGPTDDPKDENVEMDPDEHLPWPDPRLIARWWDRHRAEFEDGTRYLLGKPISIEWCERVLRHGRQRQRAAAALELAIRRPGGPLFNVAAPGFRQQSLLGLK